MTAQELIEEFNKKNPIGTLIKYQSGPEVKEAKVRWMAEFTENMTPVVFVEGEYNSINLNQIL